MLALLLGRTGRKLPALEFLALHTWLIDPDENEQTMGSARNDSRQSSRR